MTKRTINKDKCTGCLLCVVDCITKNIEVKKVNNTCRPYFKERGYCIDCGHCNAICPVGAITTDTAVISKESNPLLSLMQSKRTHRHYVKGSIIEKDILQQILQAAESSPSSSNRRTCKVIMVKEQLPQIYDMALNNLVKSVTQNGKIDPNYSNTMELNAKREEILWNAEYLVVIAGSESSTVDAAITAERMQLMAEHLGIGTGYRGDMKDAMNECGEIHEILGLKKNEKVLVCFAMGIPVYKYARALNRENKRIYYL